MWVPEEPSTVRKAVEETTEAAEVKVRFFRVPAITCISGGEGVTPAGRPVTSIVTGDENPFKGVMDTETESDEPAGSAMLDGATERLKSGGPWAGVSPPEQPQSVMVINAAVKKIGVHRARRTVLCARKANPF
jgi:hypothetical protein